MIAGRPVESQEGRRAWDRPSGRGDPSAGDGAGGIAAAGPDAALRGAGRRPARMLFGAYVVTVFALVTLNFFLPRIMPGDPISALYTEGSASYVQDGSQREALRVYYGLDEPLGAQYVDYLAGLVQGDLGIRYQVPVSELIAERLPRSLRRSCSAPGWERRRRGGGMAAWPARPIIATSRP